MDPDTDITREGVYGLKLVPRFIFVMILQFVAFRHENAT